MDRYSKFVLTVIAVALTAIAVKMFEPREAQAGVLGNGPTVGDFAALENIKDPRKRESEAIRLSYSVPLVRIRGGSVRCEN